MTEDDAKNTRCCGPDGCGEVRTIVPPPPSLAPGADLRFCVGSACMGYRLDRSGQPFCGLAGVPPTSG